MKLMKSMNASTTRLTTVFTRRALQPARRLMRKPSVNYSPASTGWTTVCHSNVTSPVMRPPRPTGVYSQPLSVLMPCTLDISNAICGASWITPICGPICAIFTSILVLPKPYIWITSSLTITPATRISIPTGSFRKDPNCNLTQTRNVLDFPSTTVNKTLTCSGPPTEQR